MKPHRWYRNYVILFIKTLFLWVFINIKVQNSIPGYLSLNSSAACFTSFVSPPVTIWFVWRLGAKPYKARGKDFCSAPPYATENPSCYSWIQWSLYNATYVQYVLEDWCAWPHASTVGTLCRCNQTMYASEIVVPMWENVVQSVRVQLSVHADKVVYNAPEFL